MRPKMVDLGDYIPGGKYVPSWLLNLGERYLGFHALNKAHARIEEDMEAGCGENFFRLACHYLPLHYSLTGLENIPKVGPCVIVSNHPHGMSDGLMFGDVAMMVRDDIRIIVNEFLDCVRGMRPYEIKVDVYGGEEATRANLASMREILRWLKDGHCILVFPSGSAATYSRRDRRVVDDPWQTNIASLIRKTSATVVPMHISGHTGLLFQLVSLMAKGKRAGLLPREIKRDCRMRHTIHLGKPISPSEMRLLGSDEALSDYLRLRTMLLRYPGTPHGSVMEIPPLEQPGGRREVQAKEAAMPNPPKHAPIDEGAHAEALEAEIRALPEECLIYRSEANPLCIYAIEAHHSPLLMKELGIQRERTFRAVGEGTGTGCDLDRFDDTYTQLIMWDMKSRRLAGAYRIGRVDKIIEKHGIEGLYNADFFRFGSRMRSIFPQSLEMGRAFITPEYQRLAGSLDTLWMGIGHFINRYPNYRYLFGTVSISCAYCETSRALMLACLQQHYMDEQLAGDAVALTPPTDLTLYSEDRRLIESAVPDLQVLNTVVAGLEPDGKGIPVLLRQYIRLGGRMVSFNIDAGFGNTLDCLVVTDLQNTPERLFRRYRGVHAARPEEEKA